MSTKLSPSAEAPPRGRVAVLKSGLPGQRFANYYKAFHRQHGFRWSTLLMILLSILSFAVGVILLFIPGPGFLFLLLGGALIAQESLTIARWMDRLELSLQPMFKRLQAWWQRRKS